MKDITKGTEKQITYATTLRDERLAQLRKDANSDSDMLRRTALLKIAKIENCDDAATLIDWITIGIHMGEHIISVREQEEIRLGVEADREHFAQSNPRPEQPADYKPAILRRRTRHTTEQQPSAKDVAYEKTDQEWAEARSQYMRAHDLKPTHTHTASAVADDADDHHAAEDTTSPSRYLDLHDVAQLVGVTDGSIRQYHKDASTRRRNGNPRPGDIPAPDVIIGTRADRAHPGWRLATIRAWLDSRPRAKNDNPGIKPGNAFDMGDGLWLVIVRITPGTLWGCIKSKSDEKQTMRFYRKYPIFTAPSGRFVTIGERGRAEDNGQGWDIQPDEFEPCPPALVLDEQDLHMPETAYRRG